MNAGRIFLNAIIAIVLLAAIFFLVPAFVYVVDQRAMAVVLQFGDPVAERTEPGIYFKAPFIQEVRTLPATRQFWGDSPADVLPDLPTKDNKKIEVVPWAVWRVNEPTVFVQRLRTMENAQQRVAQFVRGAIRDVITQYDLAELVRSTDRAMHTSAEMDIDSATIIPERTPPPAKVKSPEGPQLRKITLKIQHGRQKILAKIKAEAHRRLASGFGSEGGSRGIELIDVGISQIEFVESVRRETFNRWVAERQSIAALNTNEGERMKQEILNKSAADVERIEGEGQRKANELRGEVDAEVIRKYAAAIKEAGEFYTFVRTLEAYEKAINKDTRLILTTDSEFLRLLKQFESGKPPLPPDRPNR